MKTKSKFNYGNFYVSTSVDGGSAVMRQVSESKSVPLSPQTMLYKHAIILRNHLTRMSLKSSEAA